MRTIPFIVAIVLVLSTSVTLAQGYTAPSRDRVEALLESIDNCKKNLKKEEQELKMMEADPESVTLARYNLTKDAIKLYKFCLEKSRKELDSLRKDYPGWFNSPSATMEATVHRRVLILTPAIILAFIPDMESFFKMISGRFAAIPEPKQ